MNIFTLIKRDARHYFKSHAAVALCAALSTAVLTGALLVGDSVRFSLKSQALSRLGETKTALYSGERFFREALADEIAKELSVPVAPVLKLKGLALEPDSGARCGKVQVLGVDQRFWEMGKSPDPLIGARNEVILNWPLAAKLGVKVGDDVVLRTQKPGVLSGDAPLSHETVGSLARRMKVRAIVEEEQFGRFSLHAVQAPPFNLYLPLKDLQEKAGLKKKANLLLTTSGLEDAGQALKRCFRLEDASLKIRALEATDELELVSDQIFLSEEVERAALDVTPEASSLFTYFVTSLEANGGAVPYSMVAALDQKSLIIPEGMKDDEILVNQWLADRLKAKPGDQLKLKYLMMSPGRKIEENARIFQIRGVLPMEGMVIDRTLTPDFPGLTEGEDCSDWNPGVDIDLAKIGQEDEDYWDSYGPAPKAFITLKAGKKMWVNRFGALTAVRYPSNNSSRIDLEEALTQKLNLSGLGLYFMPVRDEALAAGEQALDFGPLFLGLSFFLIVSALALTVMLFSMGVRQRASQTGLLLAIGFTWKKAQAVLFVEGVIQAVVGMVIGVFAGLGYTRLMVYFLSSLWSGAVAGAQIKFHAEPLTLAIGGISGLLMAVLAIWITLKRQSCEQVRDLLDGIQHLEDCRKRGRISGYLAITSFVAAIVTLLALDGVAAFFIAGALLLISGLGATHRALNKSAASARAPFMNIKNLAWRSATRRAGLSFTVVLVLACGAFMVFAVGAGRKNPLEGADSKQSGTGGFQFIGESALPILHDLGEKEGRIAFGVNEDAVKGINIASLKVKEGDDASCLNLNRAQNVRILGVSKELLKGCFSFVENTGAANDDDPWRLLDEDLPEDEIPAIADQATIMWGLAKKVGDIVECRDENGDIRKLRLVAAIGNSILQGNIIISSHSFVSIYPSIEGYQAFLVACDKENAGEASKTLIRAGRNVGLEMTGATEKLAAFSEVENTYLAIFQALGGLGMLLGGVGLAFVLFRNVIEREGELAMLQAIGFTQSVLMKALLYEHAILLITGMVCGSVAAAVAVWPAILSLGSGMPWGSLGLTLAAIMLCGFLWIIIAARLAMSRKFINALRNE